MMKTLIATMLLAGQLAVVTPSGPVAWIDPKTTNDQEAFWHPTQPQTAEHATPVIYGSGGPFYTEPFMQQRTPPAEPMSPIAIVAMVLIYGMFLGILVWAVLIEMARRGQRASAADDQVKTSGAPQRRYDWHDDTVRRN